MVCLCRQGPSVTHYSPRARVSTWEVLSKTLLRNDYHGLQTNDSPTVCFVKDLLCIGSSRPAHREDFHDCFNEVLFITLQSPLLPHPNLVKTAKLRQSSLYYHHHHHIYHPKAFLGLSALQWQCKLPNPESYTSLVPACTD